jgi:phosphoenolpyruvate carboxylase
MTEKRCGGKSQEEWLDELLGNAAETKERPLRRDVGSLGRLLGTVIKEQEGEKLFETVEALRKLSISGRADQETFQPRLEIVVRRHDPEC